jgi:alpha-tubulin suppressor-like RCC1 family protein
MKDDVYAKTQPPKFKMAITIIDRIVALKTDGTLWEWYYPKTNYLNLDSVNFQQIKGISNVKSFATNENFTLVLKNDGTIWGWGNNECGQLGDGTFVKRSKPVRAKNISKIKELTIYQNHSMALKEDGTVWVWGDAGYGTKYSNGSLNSPVKVKELKQVKSIATGEDFFAALKNDGTIWTWGDEDEYVLGHNYSGNIPKQIQIPNIKDIIAISAGPRYTMALKKDGTVYEWGNGFHTSQYKNYNYKDPVIKGLNNVSKMFTGEQVNFIIKKDGTAWTWGYNQHGQLGDGCTENKELPEKVNTIDKVAQISADYFHTVFVKSDGTIWFCGYKCDPKINPCYLYYLKNPITLTTLKDVKEIAAKIELSAALKMDGTVWVWGDFRLVEKGGVSITLPKLVKGLDNVKWIETGRNFFTALKFDGTVWAWGLNTTGQLGNSMLLSQSSPVKVPVLENVKEITSDFFTLAIKYDGTVWGFGSDTESYEIGIPTKKNLSAPQQVKGLKDIKKVDISDYSYAMALGNDGSLWRWIYKKEIPKKVEGIKDIVNIENGVILKSDGTIWTINSDFQPEKMSGITGIKAIYKSDYKRIYAVDQDNIVWSINYDSSIEKEQMKLDFQQIKYIDSRLALKNDGSVLAWGNNEYGQAGNGDCSFFSKPIKLN